MPTNGVIAWTERPAMVMASLACAAGAEECCAQGNVRVINAGPPAGARTDLVGATFAADIHVAGGAILDGFDGAVVEGDLVFAADGTVSTDGNGYMNRTG